MTLVDWINVGATVWFFGCWLGYAAFARRRAKTSYNLSAVLQVYRKRWMHEMLQRQNRIADAALLSSLERNVSFLASTSIFIIAGLVTLMASAEQIHSTLIALPFTNSDLTSKQLQFKICLLIAIYVYAFFTLTWAMRQYGICAVLLGASPAADEASPGDGSSSNLEQNRQHANMTAKIIDHAGHSYNYGLRAYYFSLSVLPWLINAWLFMLAVGVVTAVLYHREFKSRTLVTLAREIPGARPEPGA